jgi:hypothetical protein
VERNVVGGLVDCPAPNGQINLRDFLMTMVSEGQRWTQNQVRAKSDFLNNLKLIRVVQFGTRYFPCHF